MPPVPLDWYYTTKPHSFTSNSKNPETLSFIPLKIFPSHDRLGDVNTALYRLCTLTRSVRSQENCTVQCSVHMRRFPEPQHFIVAAWQNWDLRSSKECPRKMIYKQMFTYFQNIGFVAKGFEASKFLHTCEGPLWSIVNCRKLLMYDWSYRGEEIYLGIWILQILVLPNPEFVII